jgi:hypothetical protein
MELLGDDRSSNGAVWARNGLVQRLDPNFLEDDPQHVLGPEHIAGPRPARHDHRRWPFLAREPGPLGYGDRPAFVVEDVLAEVLDGSVVRLRIPVDGDLLEASVEEGHVLGEEHADPPPAPRNRGGG